MGSVAGLNATQAVILDKGFAALVAEMEVAAVDQMVADFRAGILTFERAVGYVARIDQMRLMENVVESRARREVAKAQKEIDSVD